MTRLFGASIGLKAYRLPVAYSEDTVSTYLDTLGTRDPAKQDSVNLKTDKYLEIIFVLVRGLPHARV